MVGSLFVEKGSPEVGGITNGGKKRKREAKTMMRESCWPKKKSSS